MAQVYCPACDNQYPSMVELKEHLKKAQAEGEPNHIDIIELEGWDEKIKKVPSENWPVQPGQIIEETQN